MSLTDSTAKEAIGSADCKGPRVHWKKVKVLFGLRLGAKAGGDQREKDMAVKEMCGGEEG